MAATLAGCGSSPEQPAGRFVFSGDFATPNASRLFVVGADGKGLHKVTPGLARVGEGDADWSPDGSRIVFDRTFECPDPLTLCMAIWVVSADGSGEQRLTPQKPGTAALSPTWSPDGRRIAYVEYVDRSDASDLWVMNADGSGKRRLPHVGDAEEPAWAPDGRRIGFSQGGDIFFLDLDADTTTQLTRTPSLNESNPDWSPDGKRIAYELNNPSPRDFPFQEYDAYVMDADGTHKAQPLARPLRRTPCLIAPRAGHRVRLRHAPGLRRRARDRHRGCWKRPPCPADLRAGDGPLPDRLDRGVAADLLALRRGVDDDVRDWREALARAADDAGLEPRVRVQSERGRNAPLR